MSLKFILNFNYTNFNSVVLLLTRHILKYNFNYINFIIFIV